MRGSMRLDFNILHLVHVYTPTTVYTPGNMFFDHMCSNTALSSLYTGSPCRYFGRRMLLFMSSHPDFEKILEKYIPTKDLQTVRDTLFTLKTKVQASFSLVAHLPFCQMSNTVS